MCELIWFWDVRLRSFILGRELMLWIDVDWGKLLLVGGGGGREERRKKKVMVEEL